MQLEEVVRCSKRIISGAMAFQLGGEQAAHALPSRVDWTCVCITPPCPPSLHAPSRASRALPSALPSAPSPSAHRSRHPPLTRPLHPPARSLCTTRFFRSALKSFLFDFEPARFASLASCYAHHSPPRWATCARRTAASPSTTDWPSSPPPARLPRSSSQSSRRASPPHSLTGGSHWCALLRRPPA